MEGRGALKHILRHRVFYMWSIFVALGRLFIATSPGPLLAFNVEKIKEPGDEVHM